MEYWINWIKNWIDWNKYLSKPELLAQNQDLNHLVEPSFGGVNRLFVLAFGNNAQRTSNILSSKYRNKKLQCYDPCEKTFWSTSKSNKMTWKHLKNCHWSRRWLHNWLFIRLSFTENYKMITIDLSKQQALDVDPRAIQQINFTANLDREGNKRIFFILEEAKETVLNFSLS